MPAGAVTSMKASTRPPGASTSAPLRAWNGSAGWPSMAMTRTSSPSILTAITERWQPLMKRSLTRSLVRAERSSEVWPLTVWTGAVSLGSAPGAIAVPSGPSRQSSIRSTSSRSTATASLSRTTSARARDGRAWPSPSRPRSHRKVPAWRSGSCRASLPPAGERRRGPSAVRPPGTPSIPRQLRTAGTGSSLPKATSRVSPRLNRSSGPCSDQIGVAGASGRSARLLGFGLQRQRGSGLGQRRPRAISGPARPRPIRPSARVDPAGIWGLPSDRCGPFFVVSVLAVTPCPGAVKKGHFFAAEV